MSELTHRAEHSLMRFLTNYIPSPAEQIAVAQAQAILAIADQLERIANGIDSMASIAAGGIMPGDGVMPFEER